MLDKDGNFIELAHLNEAYGCNISVMQYNSIKTAIPRHWRKELKGSHFTEISKEVSYTYLEERRI